MWLNNWEGSAAFHFILRRPAGKFQTILLENFEFDVARRSARTRIKNGDKQGRAFLREETHTMVDRLAGNLFHLSVLLCFPLSLFIPVICGSHEAADDMFLGVFFLVIIN